MNIHNQLAGITGDARIVYRDKVGNYESNLLIRTFFYSNLKESNFFLF